MTLGNAAAARVRLTVWCKSCRRRVEPDAAEMAERYGAETTVLDWRDRLICSQCGSRNVDMIVTGTDRNEQDDKTPRASALTSPSPSKKQPRARRS
jgi:hypothetical protein